LVTDLPADFEVFGQAVATSMADLLGGTTGQILAKASNTNMDFTWVTNDVGDITAVTAGTGLSGGGTSGAVTLSIDTATTVDLTTAQTLTNKTLTSPALTTPTISTLTTNGDLLYGTGSGAITRRGIGTTGQVLTVSGGVPTWATPSGGSPSFVGCSIYQSTSATNISNNTTTTLNYDSEFFDTNGFHSTSTNTDRITIPTGYAGKYLITYAARFDVSGTGGRSIGISKNGSQIVEAAEGGGNSSTYQILTRSVIVDLAVADYLTFQVFQNSGSSMLVYMRSYEMPIQVQWLGA